MDLSPYKGIAQFGPDYENTLRNEPHATGSVDKVLAESMVRLCAETAEHLYGDHTSLCRRYVRGTRPQLERYLKEAPVDSESGEVIVEAICRFCSALQSRAPDEIHDLEFGGTEEEIVTRGSDWCTDVARIGCELAQIAGLTASTVGLFDIHRAHRGHDIIEV